MSSSEFDWVTARCECSPLTAFHRLKMQVEQDVESRNSKLSGRNKFRFMGNGISFAVAVDGPGIAGQAIRFKLTPPKIEVLDANDARLFDATVTLSDDGECRLMVDGSEREFWQVRKRALENLLFNQIWLSE